MRTLLFEVDAIDRRGVRWASVNVVLFKHVVTIPSQHNLDEEWHFLTELNSFYVSRIDAYFGAFKQYMEVFYKRIPFDKHFDVGLYDVLLKA